MAMHLQFLTAEIMGDQAEEKPVQDYPFEVTCVINTTLALEINISILSSMNLSMSMPILLQSKKVRNAYKIKTNQN